MSGPNGSGRGWWGRCGRSAPGYGQHFLEVVPLQYQLLHAFFGDGQHFLKVVPFRDEFFRHFF